MVDLSPLLIVGAGLARSLVGWFKNSIEDGVINDLEWKQLGATIVRVGFLGAIVIYFPGANVSVFEAGVVALGGDMVLEAVKKLKAKKK